MAETGTSRSYNMRNPAVKRILQEVKEMAKEQSEEYMSMPLEEDIFEWQFAIHGPKDSEFEGGIYHGRITLPADYPFKPPSFMLLTPSGRFETQTKICLSISNHHPEHWQPSWSVRTALVALIAFMPTKPNGAIGSLEYTKKERRALAAKSRSAAPRFGSADRQRVIDQIHEEMLKTAPPVPTTPLVEDDPSAPGDEEAARPAPAPPQPQAQPAPQPQAQADPQSQGPAHGSSSGDASGLGSLDKVEGHAGVQGAGTGSSTSGVARARDQEPVLQGGAAPAQERRPLPAAAQAAAPPAALGARLQAARARAPAPAPAPRPDSETLQERVLSLVAAALALAILFILGQKIARAYSGVAFTGGESEL